MSAFDRFKDKAEELAKKAKPKADELREKAKPMAESIRVKAERATETIKTKVNEVSDTRLGPSGSNVTAPTPDDTAEPGGTTPA